jgi:hypothetical protein
MRHITSIHPFQDVVFENETVTPDDPVDIEVVRQPGRVLFRDAYVTIRNCVFSGPAVAPLLTVRWS